MTDATVADLVRRREGDDHIGIRFGESSWTWAEVVRQAAAIAALLHAEHEEPEGRQRHVGVLMENIPEYVFWLAGTGLAGAALVGLNTSRAAPEIAADLRQADIDLVVVEEHLLPKLEAAQLPAERLLVVGSEAYRTALGRYRDAPVPDTAIPPSTVAVLSFSSGTTGTPKAVIVSQGRLAGLGLTMTDYLRIDRDSVTYLCMPLFHGNSLMMNLLPAMAAGATVCLARKFSASGFSADVHRYGATFVNYVGRALSYVLTTPPDPRDRDSTLRLAYGTEASEADIREFSERFGVEVMEGYGLSEGVFRIGRTPDTPPGALGAPRADVDVRIFDEETGEECPRARFDARGRLLNEEAVGQFVAVGRASAFEGYYRNPAATAERIRGDDFWSGDLGYRDEAGWFYFAGRSSDWIRVDGENFAAGQVERVILRMPGVRSAVVYAVPDAVTGDQVMCAVELDDGADFDAGALARFLETQPDFGDKWWPRYVRVVPAIPVTGSGKVNKATLRKEAWEAPDVAVRLGRTRDYAPLDEAGRQEIFARFREHARAGLAPVPMPSA